MLSTRRRVKQSTGRSRVEVRNEHCSQLPLRTHLSARRSLGRRSPIQMASRGNQARIAMKARNLLHPQVNPADDQAVVELPVGSWLSARRRGYTHHGIYVGGGRVAHYAGLSRGWRRGPVEIVSLAEFSLGERLWVKSTPTARYVGQAAAQRALSRLGENEYRILTNNCEHFCAWCLDGESRSRQVEGWLQWPSSIGRLIGARFGHVSTQPRTA